MDVESRDIATIGTITSAIWGGAGVLVVWIVTALNAGRRYQAMRSQIDQNAKDIAELNKAVDKMHEFFVTKDGEPRLISFAAHDIMQAACQKRMDERNDRLRERMQSHDIKLDKILEELACLRGVAVASGSFNNKGGIKN